MKKLLGLTALAVLLIAGSAFASPSPPADLFGMDYELLVQQATLASIATIPTIERTANPPPAQPHAAICTSPALVLPTHRQPMDRNYNFAIWTGRGIPPPNVLTAANPASSDSVYPTVTSPTTASQRNEPLKVSERGAAARIAAANRRNSATLDFNIFLVAEKSEGPSIRLM